MSLRFRKSVFGRFSTIPPLVLLLTAALAPAACADPVLGFREEWPGTSLQGWDIGGAGFVTYDNPGTGGVLGDGDGYLIMATPAPSNLGAVSAGAEYFGNWQAAGVTQVRVWLNDIGADDPLEIHFSLGQTQINFWQYNVGFLPPSNRWAEFVVDFTSGTWTQLFGPGTLAAAMQNVNRVHFRHDVAPYPNPPPMIAADVGIDHLLLTNGLVGVEPGGPVVARPLQLAPPFPNPSRGPVSLAFESFDGGPVRLQVVDVAGRNVRHAELAAAGPGQRMWLWDGLDDHGRRAAPGSYRVRALGASGGMSQPLVRVQ